MYVVWIGQLTFYNWNIGKKGQKNKETQSRTEKITSFSKITVLLSKFLGFINLRCDYQNHTLPEKFKGVCKPFSHDFMTNIHTITQIAIPTFPSLVYVRSHCCLFISPLTRKYTFRKHRIPCFRKRWFCAYGKQSHETRPRWWWILLDSLCICNCCAMLGTFVIMPSAVLHDWSRRF